MDKRGKREVKIRVRPEELDQEELLPREADVWQDVEIGNLSAKVDLLDQQIRQQTLDDKKSITEDRRQDTELRKHHAGKVFNLVTAWTLVVAFVIFLHGFAGVPFKLTEVEFGIVVGGMSASVVGLLVAVLSYLFPKKRDPSSAEGNKASS